MKVQSVHIALPWLMLFGLSLYFGHLFLSYQDRLPDQAWHYYIDSQQFTSHPSQQYNTILQLDHDGEGHYQPLKLQITTKNYKNHEFILDDLNDKKIDQKINIHHKNIKHAIIKSDHPINFHQYQRVRLLTAVNINDPFVQICGNFFSVIFPLIRNLIIVGLIINWIDTFLPLVIMIQSITVLVFLDNSKHYLQEFYNNILNSYVDVFNMIRLVVFGSVSSKTSSGNTLITKYGYGNNVLYNLSGQITVVVIFLLITIMFKVGGAIFKYEKLRSISSNLRGLWNGLLFCLMPRVLVFSSFAIRGFDTQNITLLNPIFGSLFILGYLVYFIALFLQIRQINQKVQYIQQNYNQIGLVSRLDYKKDFQFDCLQYSNLYYPIMNFLRLLFFYIPIGASYDLNYGSFGGVIFSQLLYIMFTISSSGYVQTRDGISYPFCDFLMMMLHLAFIAVGLAESVMHSEVSIIAEQVYFSLLLTIMVIMLTSLTYDVVNKIKQNYTQYKKDKQLNSQLQSKQSEKKKRTIIKNNQKNGQIKTTLKTKAKNGQSQQRDSDNSQQLEDTHKQNSILNIQMDMSHLKNKVRKVRKGKVV